MSDPMTNSHTGEEMKAWASKVLDWFEPKCDAPPDCTCDVCTIWREGNALIRRATPEEAPQGEVSAGTPPSRDAEEIGRLRAALETVKRTLEVGQPAIACTVWVDGLAPETLLDHVDAALSTTATMPLFSGAAGSEPVAVIAAIDEFGPRLQWYKHWVGVGVGTSLYASPVEPAPSKDGVAA